MRSRDVWGVRDFPKKNGRLGTESREVCGAHDYDTDDELGWYQGGIPQQERTSRDGVPGKSVEVGVTIPPYTHALQNAMNNSSVRSTLELFGVVRTL